MPDIARCSACGRETYATLAICPHCGRSFVPDKASAQPTVSTFTPEIAFNDFVSGSSVGAVSIEYDTEKIGSSAYYPFAPKVYTWEMVFRLLVFPLLALSSLAVAAVWPEVLGPAGIDGRSQGRTLGLFFVVLFTVLIGLVKKVGTSNYLANFVAL